MSYISDIAEEIRREVPPNVLPEGNTDLLFLLYAALALAVGENIQAKDVHNAWAVWMAHQEPSHESIRPFSELSPETQRQDQPFVDAIRKVAVRFS